MFTAQEFRHAKEERNAQLERERQEKDNVARERVQQAFEEAIKNDSMNITIYNELTDTVIQELCDNGFLVKKITFGWGYTGWEITVPDN